LHIPNFEDAGEDAERLRRRAELGLQARRHQRGHRAERLAEREAAGQHQQHEQARRLARRVGGGRHRAFYHQLPACSADQVLFDPAVSERRFRISMSDLAVGFMPELEAGCYQQRLFDQTFACAVRKDHPRIASRVTTIRPIGGCGRCLRSFSWSRC
jgi:hypothetical protein